MADEPATPAPDPSNFARSAVERITNRIQQVEFAKALAARKEYGKAIEILSSVRDKYVEERMRLMVDRMIDDYQKASGSS